MPQEPRISFGIIVLNGEPFTRYCLRALYPFAHEILVVEGAVERAAGSSTCDGHSIDGTLDTLSSFKSNEDPEDKVKIITKHGFWDEKDDQSRAYADRATGNWLWQIDIDEFYQPADMQRIIDLVSSSADISAVSLRAREFWGGFDYWVDAWFLRRGAELFHRLFRYAPGYQYLSHRPPTVVDEHGVDLRRRGYLEGSTLYRNHGILLYHYSYLFPFQVLSKSRYYGTLGWEISEKANEWAACNFMGLRHPFRVHNAYTSPSWLERFTGIHPPAVQALREDLHKGKWPSIEMRPTHDIEALLNARWYGPARCCLKLADYTARPARFAQLATLRLARSTKRHLGAKEGY